MISTNGKRHQVLTQILGVRMLIKDFPQKIYAQNPWTLYILQARREKKMENCGRQRKNGKPWKKENDNN